MKIMVNIELVVIATLLLCCMETNSLSGKACHIYPLRRTSQESYRTPDYVTSSGRRTISVSFYSAIQDMLSDNLNISVIVNRDNVQNPINIYIRGHKVYIRLKGSKKAEGALRFPSLYGFTNDSTNLLSRQRRQLPLGIANSLTDPPWNAMNKEVITNSVDEKYKDAIWWSLTFIFTRKRMIIKENSFDQAISSVNLDSRNTTQFTTFVSSDMDTAVMFDCLQGCPKQSSPIANQLIPLPDGFPLTFNFCFSVNSWLVKTIKTITMHDKCSEDIKHQMSDKEHLFKFLVIDKVLTIPRHCLTIRFQVDKGIYHELEGQDFTRVCKEVLLERNITYSREIHLLIHNDNHINPYKLERQTAEDKIFIKPTVITNMEVSVDCKPQDGNIEVSTDFNFPFLRDSDGEEINLDEISELETKEKDDMLMTWVVIVLILLITLSALCVCVVYLRSKKRWEKVDSTLFSRFRVPSSLHPRHLSISSTRHQEVTESDIGGEKGSSPRKIRKPEEVSEPNTPEPERQFNTASDRVRYTQQLPASSDDDERFISNVTCATEIF